MKRSTAFLLLILFSFSLACRRETTEDKNARRYPLHGKVVSVDLRARQVILSHDDIPGFMKGMTMPFNVHDQAMLERMQPNDDVHATLVVGADHSWLEDIVVARTEAAPGAPATGLREVQPGDEPADFQLVNQDGKKISLHQFRGEPLVLTFIYTRCPLPDYCIRMSGNFRQIAKFIKAKELEATLLTVTIDPEFDNPQVLREYGRRYGADTVPGFRRWQFATGKPEDIKQMAGYFGLSYVREKDQITHSLRTVIIDKNGRVATVLRGNEWTIKNFMESNGLEWRSPAIKIDPPLKLPADRGL